MAVRYYTSTYIELLSTDVLPSPALYGLRARYTDTDEKFTFDGSTWNTGWYGLGASGTSQTSDDGIVQLTWPELVLICIHSDPPQWSKYYVTDVDKYIQIVHKDPDGGCWYESINTSGQITHMKIE